MTEIILKNIIVNLSLFVRVVTVTCAILLIVRSLSLRYLPVQTRNILSPLYGITDVIIIPVRSLLPDKYCSDEIDYSPLISAIIIIVSGLGLEELIKSIAGLSGLF